MNTDSWFDWWDKSDPYLKFLKLRHDNTLIEAGRTNVVPNNLNPNWMVVDISVGKLVRSDNAEQKFKVECWDWEEEGEVKHQFIGEIYLTLSELNSYKTPIEFPLSNPKQKKPGQLVL
jgi:Ca2+-dependent lipid-binding protein